MAHGFDRRPDRLPDRVLDHLSSHCPARDNSPAKHECEPFGARRDDQRTEKDAAHQAIALLEHYDVARAPEPTPARRFAQVLRDHSNETARFGDVGKRSGLVAIVREQCVKTSAPGHRIDARRREGAAVISTPVKRRSQVSPNGRKQTLAPVAQPRSHSETAGLRFQLRPEILFASRMKSSRCRSIAWPSSSS